MADCQTRWVCRKTEASEAAGARAEGTELLPELPGYIAHGQLATPAKLALT